MQGMKRDKSKMKGMAMADKTMKNVPGASGEKMPDTSAQNKPKPDNAPQKPDAPAVASIAPTPAKPTVDDKAPAKAVDTAKAADTVKATPAPDTAKPAGDKTATAQTPGYKVDAEHGFQCR